MRGLDRAKNYGHHMAKLHKCADVDPKMRGGSFVAEGRDKAEVMKKAADHAKDAHGTALILPDVRRAEGASRDSRRWRSQGCCGQGPQGGEEQTRVDTRRQIACVDLR